MLSTKNYLRSGRSPIPTLLLNEKGVLMETHFKFIVLVKFHMLSNHK